MYGVVQTITKIQTDSPNPMKLLYLQQKKNQLMEITV